MKTMKKSFKLVLALVLAAMMIVSMIPAMAASTGTHTISVANTDTHKYAVYQILTGELSENGKTLSNVSWGSSVKAQTEGKINGMTAAEFGKSLEGLSGVDAVTAVGNYFDAATAANVESDTKKVGIVDKDHPLVNQPTGYYVMVDVTADNDLVTSSDDTNYYKEDTRALNVIMLVANVTVTKKWGTSENDKFITADTLGKDSGTNTYNPGTKQDNVSIGDTVTYTLKNVVPENADRFKDGTFFFIITDTLSEGLTFNNDIAVTASTSGALATPANYTIKTSDIGDHTFEIGLVNAASYKGQTITVTYTATLNEKAVIGDEGNPNTSTVIFSNNPNKTYDGSPEDENHKGFPDSKKDVPTGETPDKTTRTYTTGIEILKVDEKGNPLTKNVKFELTGQSAKKVVTKITSFVAYTDADSEHAADYKYYKLNDGTYTMTEPSDDSMSPAEAGATKGYVEDSTATAGTAGAIEVNGTTYRPYVPETDSSLTVYILNEGSRNAYENGGATKYKKTVTEKTIDTDTADHKMQETPDSNGIVRFDGLGAGKYTLEEIQWPDGYNKAENVTLTVSYQNNTPRFTVSGGEAHYEDGVIKIKIVNRQGGLLPETGGIGTTIFYIAGSLLAIGAAILLITKRRMGADE